MAATNEDVQVATNIVSLRCPLTGARVRRAGRFEGIDALAGFDLDAYLSVAARTRKWQCPVTMRHSCVQQLQNDAFLQGILDRLQVRTLSLPHLHSCGPRRLQVGQYTKRGRRTCFARCAR